MKRARIALIVLFLCAAMPSFAEILYKQLPEPTETGGAGIRTCIAEAAYKQKCQKCQSAYSTDGVYLGLLCVPVKYSAQCTCSSEGDECSTQGTCTYNSSIW